MRVGFGAIHHRPSPSVAARVGMGDVNAQLQAWLSSLGGEPGVDAAVGCGPSGGAPCGSPEAAAQMAITIAQQACVQESYAADFPGYVADPLCADGGTAAGQAFASQALAYFNALPASVWTTEAQNAAAGLPYGPTPGGGGYGELCPSGIQGPNGTCVGTPTPIPFNITTGAPTITSAPPAQPALPTLPASSAPSAPAGGTSSGTSSGTTGGTSNTNASTSDPLAWLTESAIAGIPNWWLLAGGLVAVVALPMILKRGR
jgi:hypothetical protein